MNAWFLAALLVPASADNWAVIMAGSNTYGNYRHQADACHAYQIAKKNGIPESNIILLAYDDIANDNGNPFPGIEYNKPTAKGVPGVDVYKGCKISYRGPDVTGENFMKVLKGDTSAPGPVLKSTKDDRVFVYFTDHGGTGILGVPYGAAGGYIHAKDLNAALEKATYKELLFYLEACESGSIFSGLLKAPNAFAVTAANPTESSWGFYCPPNDTVAGTELNSCLGDEFSINWLEDADIANFHVETVRQQVAKVTQKTKKSHVTQYGDNSTIPGEVIGDFEGKEAAHHRVPLLLGKEDYSNSAVSTRDVELHLAYYALRRAKSQADELRTHANLESVRAKRAVVDARFSRIALNLEPDREKALEFLEGPVDPSFPRYVDCHQAALKVVTKECGALDDYSMRYSRLFANLCSSQFKEESIRSAVVHVCSPNHSPPVPKPISSLPGTIFDFKGDEFHVMFVEGSMTSLRQTDLYHLTGHLADEGGVVTAKCLNETETHKCSHSMKFTKAYKPFPGRSPEILRNFSASIGGKVLSGRANFVNETGRKFSCEDIVYGSDQTGQAVMLPGPNPPPSPPPVLPTICTSAFNQSGCAKMANSTGAHNCIWCKSSDEVHELCFTKGHTPKKDWSCVGDDVLVV